MRLIGGWLVLAVVLLAAATLRFIDLDRSAMRADEINYLFELFQGPGRLTLFERWSTPPGLDQQPFPHSIAIVWHWFRPGPPGEQSVREPYALIGLLTVVGVMVWLFRRRGLAAAVLVGVWMGLLPYHVAQSREAYYYVVVMAFSAGMTLQTVDLFSRLRARKPIPTRAYVTWATWTLMACLCHICAWVVAALCWGLLLWAGLASLPAPRRRPHVKAMAGSAALITLVMIRFVLRAIEHVRRSAETGGLIGGDFTWVAPRVIPFFTAGANLPGIAASLLLLIAGVWFVARTIRRTNARRDPLYEALTIVVGAGFIAVYAYVGLLGGGKAKVTYFSAMLPVFLVWAAYTCDIVAASLAGGWPIVMRVALPCLIAGVLAKPAWMVTRLEGKPTPYKQIRDWLDANLDPGSVVLIDRWFEPWNEMRLYAPKKAFVTFPVPDEPYELYRQLQWRDVAQRMIEQGKAQAFIRLVRNHEGRDGLWTWPETHLAHRGVIVNDVAVWLRDHGYVADEPYYDRNQKCIVTEIFYDLRDDAVKRRQAAGERFAVFFDETMPYEKTGPLGIFRVQTQQFMDWRVLGQSGFVDVYNLQDTAQRARLRVRAVSPAGPKLVVGAGTQRFDFGGGQFQEWVMDAQAFEPGSNPVSFTDPGWERDRRPLFIEGVDVLPETDTSR
ncbi:MAG: hypothetical protein ACKOSQ_06885 [Planctomycetaceae bacterium]